MEELYPEGKNIDKDLYLVAQWRANAVFRLAFVVEDGIELGVWDIDNGVITKSLPVPIREGYDFLGWCTTKSVNYYFDNTQVLHQDTTVYAKWVEIGPTEKPIHTVTLRYGNGIADGKVEIESGRVLTAQEAPINVGYSFGSYTIDEQGKIEYKMSMPVTSSFVLYVQWKQEPRLTVTFDTNGGNSITPYSVLYNATIFKPETPKKEGCRFLGWAASNDENPVWFDFATELITHDWVLYAIWDKAPQRVYTVTFIKNNDEPDATLVFEDTDIVFPSLFKQGSEFIGWFFDEQCTKPYVEQTSIFTFTVYACWAPLVQQDGFSAHLVEDRSGYRIDGYSGAVVTLTIPDQIEGLPVVEIGANAFQNLTSIHSLSLPADVAKIGEYAFDGCTSLQTIEIAEQSALHTIETYAFNQTAVTNLVLRNTIKKIGSFAFAHTALTNLVIYANPQLDDNSFCSNSQLQYVSAPNLTVLGMHAFADCTNLQTVSLPKAVTIDTGAFKGCSSLLSIDLPNVVTLNSEAFCECWQLSQISLPKVQYVNSNCFSGAVALTSIDLPSIVSLGQSTFYSCSNLQHIGVGAKLNSLAELVFDGCSSAVFAMLAEGGKFSVIDGSLVCGSVLMAVGNIGDDCVYHIPTACTSADNSAFASGRLIKYLYIGKQFVSMGEMCPMTLTGIQRFYVDQQNPVYSVDERGSLLKGKQLVRYADRELTTTYTFDSSITSIAACAFTGCRYLREVVLSNTYTSIDVAAFYQCYSLRKVSNAQSVVSVGAYAFFECTQLSFIDLSDDVSIGENAFRRTQIEF